MGAQRSNWRVFLFQEVDKALRQSSNVRNLALPNFQDTPSHSSEFPFDPIIPCPIPRNLVLPKSDIRAGKSSTRTLAVPVPKTAMDKNDFAVLGQYDIRFTRKVAAVKAKSESQPCEQSADKEFRSSILSANT